MKSVKRFYSELKPSQYDLKITPDAEKLTFTGKVTVHLRKTGRPSQRITFHQHGLKISAATIIKKDKKGEHAIPVKRINNQNTLDEVRLHTDDMLYSGEYVVTMDFSGVITKGMTGLYPCYFNLDGKEHMLLATQFESHYARELFPCIDEPEAKATFDLTLVAPKDLTLLANTPIKTQTPLSPDSNLWSTSFETTPQMSTYLLAFVIGELQSKSTMTKRGTEVSVWSTIAHPLDSLDFALDAAKRSIEFFEDYFGIDYPLPKADHIGLPDFTSGAMENWGLITYRERVLLAYPGEASQSIKEHIAMVIAHETSHQWFGNLVTMRWWDDVWLNESFANMMEYQAVDALFPDWDIWDTFIMSEGLASLRRDATPGVQAIKTGVRHPDEINTIFDPSIVYAKGGRVLYMLKTYIGEEAFRKGLTQYFKKHAYGNTTGADLWQALGEASGIDVGSFMNPWLERSGFPVVTVNQEQKSVAISQEHFLENGEKSDGRIWPVPLFAHHRELPARLDKAELRKKLTSDDALIINNGSAGHYIVNYANQEQRSRIIDLVSSKKLGIADRLMLLNSASMLAKAKYQSFADVLELLRAYDDEQDEAVWAIIALIIAESRRFIDLDETLEDRIKQFIRTLVSKEYARLDWEEKNGESAADTKLRATILSLGAYAEEPAIVSEALRRFDAYKSDPKQTAPELRGIIFSVPVKQRTPGAFDYLIQLHDQTVNSDLRADAMAGLTATKSEDEAQTLLERLKDAKLVKPQDADYWLIYLLRNRYTRQVAWDWMVSNWQWIVTTYAHDKSYDHFPRYAASVCNTPAWANKYAAFFKPKADEIALERAITMGITEIDTRVAWLARDLESVQKFFKA